MSYYKENMFKRGWNAVTGFFKGIPSMRFDAVAGAIGFFVILVAMLEYKVFESMYGMTRDIILTASTLLVTAFGGVYSEVVLRRNATATDDQNLQADAIFYISLATSALIGLGAWVQAIGLETVRIGDFYLTLPEFSQLAVSVITIVTIVDILLLREYFRGDVKAQHKRKIEQSNTKKIQADFQVEDALIEFEAEVKSKTEQILRVEKRRKEVRENLTSLYGGSVPADVMKLAMRKLDEIMQEIKTGEDLNKDGIVGLSAQSFASTAQKVELDPKASAGNDQKPPQTS